MSLVKINSRKYFINADDVVITPVSAGRWEVTYDKSTFLVVGGRKSGGGEREWFVHHPLFFGEQWLPCKSMVEAVKLGAQY